MKDLEAQCPLHPLHEKFELLPSGQRLGIQKARSNRMNNSVISMMTQLMISCLIHLLGANDVFGYG